MGENELILPPPLFVFLLSLKGQWGFFFYFANMFLPKSKKKKKTLNLFIHSFKRAPQRQRSWENLLT